MMELGPGPLLLVGGGKMGVALARGWTRGGIDPSRLLVVEPDPARANLLVEEGFTLVEPATMPADEQAAALVLAVKPQMMDAALPAYVGHVGPSTLVLSIAAGKPIASFEAAFGAAAAVVRSMPNTPAAVGRGITVLCANGSCDERRRALASALMAAVGEVAWVDDERQLHAVTALSGGGPAYVFLLIEALAQAGERLGLEPDLAMRLARVTVEGSGELARLSAAPAAQLRADVTSPGGTTRAALDVLMRERGLPALVDEALAAAARRSAELASA